VRRADDPGGAAAPIGGREFGARAPVLRIEERFSGAFEELTRECRVDETGALRGGDASADLSFIPCRVLEHLAIEFTIFGKARISLRWPP
jgi:hypothetical protein